MSSLLISGTVKESIDLLTQWIIKADNLGDSEFVAKTVKKTINYMSDRAIQLIRANFGKKMDTIYLIRSMGAEADFMVYNETAEYIYDLAVLKIEGENRGRLVRSSDFSTSVFDFYQHGFKTGYSIDGWEVLSEHYKPAKRELTVVTGIPSHGKSEFIDQLLVKLNIQHGLKFAIYSPENFPYENHAEKLISKYMDKPFHEGRTARMDEDELTNGLAWLDENLIFLEPHEDDTTLDAILNLAKKTVEVDKIDGLVIDPWTEIEQMRAAGQTETDYINQCLTKLRRFARNNNIMIWIIAHPAKMKRQDNGEYPVPTPYDISGSAHWRNKADNCITVYRNTDDNVEINIQKIRFKLRGKIGAILFSYDKPTGTYSELRVL